MMIDMNQRFIPSRMFQVFDSQGSHSPMTASLPHSISFHFQVVEYTDQDGRIVKSRLEVQRNIHDDYGNISYSEPWFEVPRIQRPI